MREEPLMEGLIGQMNKKKDYSEKGSYVIKDPLSNDSDMRTYRLDTINFDVPIRGDKVMNANIKANLLSDDEMKALGFQERPFHWVFKDKVSFLEGMDEYLIITIGKQASGINIKVFDEFIELTYDYQSILYDDEFNEYANRIHTNVQNKIMKLVDAGLITGYKRNDYI